MDGGMKLGLGKRRALVTGASRGLGRAIALALAEEGAQVLAVARDLQRLGHLEEADERGQGGILGYACDLADASAIAGLAPLVGHVDILVINTGGPPPGPADDTSDEVWTRQFEAMFLSAIRLTRLVLPGMRERRFGRILVVTSSGVIQPIPNLAVSNALRSALIGWAKTLANEVAGDGVTVNCLAPGRIATDRVAELDKKRAEREKIDVEQVAKESRSTIPVGRYGDPTEFAAVAVFLASEQASYMTGGVVRVDGGMIRSL
jgi:3-oxoacyl-[acyl-carrier protein] reductase